MKNFTLKLAATLTALLPTVALADKHPEDIIGDAADVVSILDTIAGFMFIIFIALAVVFLLYAAFLYLTAAGNGDKVKTARNVIIYSVVALVVAIIAGGIPAVVCTILTATCP